MNTQHTIGTIDYVQCRVIGNPADDPFLWEGSLCWVRRSNCVADEFQIITIPEGSCFFLHVKDFSSTFQVNPCPQTTPTTS